MALFFKEVGAETVLKIAKHAITRLHAINVSMEVCLIWMLKSVLALMANSWTIKCAILALQIA
jgi:hypothetical protein